DALCSQIDLVPTLLSLAGVDYRAPFLGVDLPAQPPGPPGRASLIHNRDIGLLTDTALIVLGLRREVTFYRRKDRTSDIFTPATPNEIAGLSAMADRAAAVFQVAAEP